MKLYDISYDLLTAPLHRGDTPPELQPIQSMDKGDPCNLSILTTNLHCATHIDAPRHTVPDGKTIGQLPMDLFYGPCRVVTCPAGPITGQDIDCMHIQNDRRLLIRGLGAAYFTLSAAYALAAESIQLIGIDAPALTQERDAGSVYRVLQQAGIVSLEGLSMHHVPSGRYTLFAPPVLISDADAAPCRAVLFTLD